MTKNGQYLVSPYSANGDHITESQKQWLVQLPFCILKFLYDG